MVEKSHTQKEEALLRTSTEAIHRRSQTPPCDCDEPNSDDHETRNVPHINGTILQTMIDRQLEQDRDDYACASSYKGQHKRKKKTLTKNWRNVDSTTDDSDRSAV
jgi:hypothetical protein